MRGSGNHDPNILSSGNHDSGNHDFSMADVVSSDVVVDSVSGHRDISPAGVGILDVVVQHEFDDFLRGSGNHDIYTAGVVFKRDDEDDNCDYYDHESWIARNAISGSCEDLAASGSKPERLDEFDKNGSCEDLAASVSVDDDGGSMALGILPNLFQFLSEVGALSLLQAMHEFDLTKTISSVSQLSEHHVCLNRFAPEFVLWMSDVKSLEVLAARVDDSFDEWMNEIAVASCYACASPPCDHDVPDLLVAGPASVQSQITQAT